ncbi:unnamed protein product [Peniophora sp. CBMAI 1063]|nr:unnamed protein product [Peniophora sp. CBMAI 1063]
MREHGPPSFVTVAPKWSTWTSSCPAVSTTALSVASVDLLLYVLLSWLQRSPIKMSTLLNGFVAPKDNAMSRVSCPGPNPARINLEQNNIALFGPIRRSHSRSTSPSF